MQDALAPQQERSRQSLRRIMSAAQAVLLRDGVERFSIGAVASAAGMSVGGLYGRVPGKTELLQALKDQAMEETEAGIFARLSENRLTTYARVIRALVGAIVEQFSRNEDLHRILFQTANTAMTASGAAARHRSFEHYQSAMATIFGPPVAPAMKSAIRLSFDLIVSATLSRVRSTDEDDMSWHDFAEHLTIAAVAYIQAVEGRELGSNLKALYPL